VNLQQHFCKLAPYKITGSAISGQYQISITNYRLYHYLPQSHSKLQSKCHHFIPSETNNNLNFNIKRFKPNILILTMVQHIDSIFRLLRPKGEYSYKRSKYFRTGILCMLNTPCLAGTDVRTMNWEACTSTLNLTH